MHQLQRQTQDTLGELSRAVRVVEPDPSSGEFRVQDFLHLPLGLPTNKPTPLSILHPPSCYIQSIWNGRSEMIRIFLYSELTGTPSADQVRVSTSVHVPTPPLVRPCNRFLCIPLRTSLAEFFETETTFASTISYRQMKISNFRTGRSCTYRHVQSPTWATEIA